MEIEQAITKFKEIYGNCENIRVFYAPGRVNLIGEHIDYSGGYVFPCALSFGTVAVVTKTTDNIIRFASTSFDLTVEARLDDIVYKKEDEWANYIKGVISELQKESHPFSGLNILITGEIPYGAGLSSSASLEVLMAVALNDIFELSLDMVHLVKVAQKAENNFIGVMCGIMDQFAVGMGKAENAILLDCKSLEYSYAPLVLNDYKLVIANTNKRRGLADSKYNERRKECEAALADLQTKADIKCLCDLNSEQFDKIASAIKSPVNLKRARHAVYENERVKKAVKALQNNDLVAFGAYINDSHKSLKDDYEVTGVELDTLAELAQKFDGCLGSRMTGAGFGGCTVSIVKESEIDNFIVEVGDNYTKKTGLKADFYVAGVSDGAREVNV